MNFEGEFFEILSVQALNIHREDVCLWIPLIYHECFDFLLSAYRNCDPYIIGNGTLLQLKGEFVIAHSYFVTWNWVWKEMRRIWLVNFSYVSKGTSSRNLIVVRLKNEQLILWGTFKLNNDHEWSRSHLSYRFLQII